MWITLFKKRQGEGVRERVGERKIEEKERITTKTQRHKGTKEEKKRRRIELRMFYHKKHKKARKKRKREE
ncbi:MAG: hypothetical protein WC155_11125 [Candidatus Cloacimonadales bacterium]